MTSPQGPGRAGPGARPSRPHRPAFLRPAAFDGFVGGEDPALRADAAHRTAEALVAHGRGCDAAETARLVALADEHGLEEVAQLWADRPPESLPGALWRLYALRAGVRQDPEGLARAFDTGRRRAEVDEAVAGVADPPGPAELRAVADAVLAGAFAGDFAVALERAAAFCRVVATGMAVLADADDDAGRAAALTRRAGSLARTGSQLTSAATSWRDGELH